MWIALLNMEYKYGTTESLEKAFSTAVAESKVPSFTSSYISFVCSSITPIYSRLTVLLFDRVS